MKIKNTNRKTHNIVLFGVIIFVILLGAFFIYKLAFSEEKYKNLENISLKTLNTKLENKDSFILVISQTGCSHCEQYLPELEKTLANYNIDASILNISNLSDQDNKEFSSSIHFSGTPTTIFFTDGEEKTTLNRLIGYTSSDKVVERLKSLGYIE